VCVYLSVYMFACLPLCLSECLYVCGSVWSVCLPAYLWVLMCVCLSVYLFACLPLCLSVRMCVCVCACVCLSVCGNAVTINMHRKTVYRKLCRGRRPSSSWSGPSPGRSRPPPSTSACSRSSSGRPPGPGGPTRQKQPGDIVIKPFLKSTSTMLMTNKLERLSRANPYNL